MAHNHLADAREPQVFAGTLASLNIAFTEGIERITIRIARSTDVLTVILTGPKQLTIRQYADGWNAESNWLLYLEVADVSDRQLEGVSFLVSDPENDVISCYCRAVEVTKSPLIPA